MKILIEPIYSLDEIFVNTKYIKMEHSIFPYMLLEN